MLSHQRHCCKFPPLFKGFVYLRRIFCAVLFEDVVISTVSVQRSVVGTKSYRSATYTRIGLGLTMIRSPPSALRLTCSTTVVLARIGREHPRKG